jgi:hypothetical protein
MVRVQTVHSTLCAAGRDVYVDIAGWHLFMRDMNAVPGFKMSQALATQLGPEVSSTVASHQPMGHWAPHPAKCRQHNYQHNISCPQSA